VDNRVLRCRAHCIDVIYIIIYRYMRLEYWYYTAIRGKRLYIAVVYTNNNNMILYYIHKVMYILFWSPSRRNKTNVIVKSLCYDLIFVQEIAIHILRISSHTHVCWLTKEYISYNNKSLNHNSRDDVIRISSKRFDDAYTYMISYKCDLWYL